MNFKNNIYIGDEIITKTSNNKHKKWVCKLRFVINDEKIYEKHRKTNWVFNNNDTIQIKTEWIKNNEFKDDKYVIESWTEYGIEGGKITISAPKYIHKGTNIGRSNFSNMLITAINKCISKTNKKKPSKNKIILPMVPTDIRNIKDIKKYISFPLIAQIKYDGNRAMYYNGDLYTRRGKKIPNNKHTRGIYNDIKKLNKECVFDAELFIDNTPLQDITSMSRSVKGSKKYNKELRLNIFDMFKTNKKSNVDSTPLIDRLSRLNDIKDTEYIKIVKHKIINSEKEQSDYFNEAMDKNMEGIVIKKLDSKYTYSRTNEVRTRDWIKVKPVFKDIFDIKDFKADENKCIVFELLTKNGISFNSTYVNKTKDECRNEYNKAVDYFKKNNESYYKNKKMEVKYFSLSKTGVPLLNKSVRIII